MNEKNYKAYVLKNGMTIIGNEVNEETLEDVLMFNYYPIGQAPNGAMIFSTSCVPMGLPINNEAVTLIKDDLGILFEVKKLTEFTIQKYEDVLESLKNPDAKIVKPKSRIIS